VAGEAACARCGLLVERWDGFAVSEDPPGLAEQWAECVAKWDDAERHDRAVVTAMGAAALPQLARRYRDRLDSGPDPIAEARLKQIAVLVEHAARAQSERIVSPTTQRAWRVAAVMVAAAVAVVAALLLLIALNRR
jgi:anti-sigma-K factor RskA